MIGFSMASQVFSMWRLVKVQIVLTVVAFLLAWLFSQSAQLVFSVFYGAASVIVPSTLMVVAMSRFSSSTFFVWEAVKVFLISALLFLVVWLVPDLNWIGLFVGLLVTLKAYWWCFWGTVSPFEKYKR